MKLFHPLDNRIRNLKLMLLQTLSGLFRHIARNKSLTLLNLTGLALGFSSCLLIALYLFDQLKYDAHHSNLDRIYRINTRFVTEGMVDDIAISAAPLPFALTNFPEVEEVVRFDHKGNGVKVKTSDGVFREKLVYAADPSVFKIFSYDFIDGNPHSALEGLYQVVLTRSAAIKYFGATNVSGSILEVDGQDHLVAGVMEDLPDNSDLTFSMLLSMPADIKNDDWFDFGYYVFVLFTEEATKDPASIKAFNKKLERLADEHINAAIKKENVNMSGSMSVSPLHGLHFDNSHQYDTPKGNRSYIIIFASVAILILVIAAINYINFSIVQSMERSREVGIRKVIGSTFKQLVVRYILQSIVLTFIGLILSIAIVAVLLPFFNDIVDRHFSLSQLLTTEIVISIIAILVVTGVLAGSYPAFYGSSMRIVDALKGHVASPGGKLIRNSSITIQFAITLALVIATVIVYLQMQFINNFDLGFRRDNILVIKTPEDSVHYPTLTAFKTALLQLPTLVKDVSLAGDGAVPGDPNDSQRGSLTLTHEEGKEEVRMINYTSIDEQYFKMLDVKIKAGEPYAPYDIHDQKYVVVINDALAQSMGWKDPLSQSINFNGHVRKVIGVVGGVHFSSLYNPIQPQIFVPHNYRIVSALVALQPNADNELSQLQQIWIKYFPDHPFTYNYLDDTINEQYRQERIAAKVLTYFALITIAISLMGLIGLSFLSAFQRRKEIGIRKIVGADFKDIALLFSREYFLLVTLACMVAIPGTWYLMDTWLATFVQRANVNIFIYLVAALLFAITAFVAIALSITRLSRINSTQLIRE